MSNLLKGRSIFTVALFLIPALLPAQKMLLSGHVLDAGSGKPLAGANVRITGEDNGSAADSSGRFTFSLPAGRYSLVGSFLGYSPDTLEVNLRKDLSVELRLIPDTLRIQTTEVMGRDPSIRIQARTPGMISLPASEFRKIPSLLGEADPFNLLRSLPGVQSVGEGTGYLYIRGGSADQNLVLLDGAVLYNPAHLLGLFSTFNPAVIDTLTICKGYIPAEYGGRLASVIQVATREGNVRKVGGEVSAGLVSSRIMLEGPLVKDKLSFQVAARRSWLDLLSGVLIPDTSSFAGSGYYFQDFNAHLTWRVNPKNRLSLAGYSGNDQFSLFDKEFRFGSDMNWSNRSLSLLWDASLNRLVTLNSGITASGYLFAFDMHQSLYQMTIHNGISQVRVFSALTYSPSASLRIRAGAESSLYRFEPVMTQAAGAVNEVEVSDPYLLRSREGALFAQTTWEPAVALLPRISLGIRAFYFDQVGPYVRFTGAGNNPRADSLVFAPGERVASWTGLEPRLALTLSVHEYHQVKFSASYQYQPIHMVPFSAASLPIDLWISSTTEVSPQRGTSFSAGWFTDYSHRGWDAYIEGFWKILNRQVELNPDITLLDYIKGNFDRQFTIGKGQAYGFELMIRKKSGRHRGWIGYTWSKALRFFPELNNGQPFYARHDRRHDLNLVYQQSLNKQWQLAVQFVLATGQPGIIPQGLYFFEGNVINSFTGMSSFRFPPYHRLDISFTKNPGDPGTKKPNKVLSSWSFGVYNLYNRLNPFLIYYDASWNPTTELYSARSRQISLLPLVPFVTWTGRF